MRAWLLKAGHSEAGWPSPLPGLPSGSGCSAPGAWQVEECRGSGGTPPLPSKNALQLLVRLIVCKVLYTPHLISFLSFLPPSPISSHSPIVAGSGVRSQRCPLKLLPASLSQPRNVTGCCGLREDCSRVISLSHLPPPAVSLRQPRG